MIRTFLCALAFVCLFSFSASAQIDDPEAVFAELRSLEGTWFMPTDRGDRLEIWTYSNDSTLVGRDVRIKPENGDSVLLETLRLELRDTNIFYIVTARGQNNNKPVSFRLTAADENGYLFENPDHDDPQSIRYRLLGNREVQVTLEGERNGRPVKTEYVFEREFAPGSVEFRVRLGANAHRLHATGQFPQDLQGNKQDQNFGLAPGWDLGATATFNGRGGYLRINVDLGLSGRYPTVDSDLRIQSDTFIRKGNYKTNWLTVAVVPEMRLRREGKLSILAGPYFGLLISNRFKGETDGVLSNFDSKLLKSIGDLKKTDIGLTFGLQYALNFGKKDIGGILGLRANLGLKDLDNLYSQYCTNTAFCNGQVKMQGISLYYSANLLKL
ncbi:MAG: PorT family protein [Saprospiraceae bacterium]|nr:PorT family protein [Saprospiraceae bacterium]